MRTSRVFFTGYHCTRYRRCRRVPFRKKSGWIADDDGREFCICSLARTSAPGTAVGRQPDAAIYPISLVIFHVINCACSNLRFVALIGPQLIIHTISRDST